MVADKIFDLSISSKLVYQSDIPIKGKTFVKVFIDRAGEGTWEVIDGSNYQLINDSLVFTERPTGSLLIMQVATTPSELQQTPTDTSLLLTIKEDIKTLVANLGVIVVVHDSLDKVTVVADNIIPLSSIYTDIVPNLTEILQADTNAQKASTSATQALGYRNEAEAFSISNVFIVNTIEDLVTVPSNYTTAIVKDTNRGGTFIWSATGTANGGTVFAGATGFWHRQYSGAVNVKWFGYGLNGRLFLYVSKTGSDSNNGFTPLTPFLTIQKAIDFIATLDKSYSSVQIIIGDGVYQEAIDIPNNLVNKDTYLRFTGSVQSLQQDPSTWTGVIIDGTLEDGNNTKGFNIGAYNNVECEYILFKNWYNNSLTNTQQVQVAVNVEQFANAYFYGCAAIGNGFNNIYVNPMGRAVITGGVYDGSRYVINNTGGRLSMSANSSSERSIIKNGLEYGLYAKHQSSSVLDYTEFENNGQIAAASSYGSALFAYKSGTSIDTRSCVFNKNNIVYNARGGFIASHPNLPDIMGSAANLNDRIWLNKGYGADDLINYTSLAGRDITRGFGGGSVTGTTPALAYSSGATIPKSYLMNTDQYIMIEIWGSNNAGGDAQCLPSLYDNVSGTRYQLETFLVPNSETFKLQLLVQASTGGRVASVFWNSIGASKGGKYVGQNVVNPINFATADLEFQVWGTTTSTNTLTIRKATCVLWG